MPVKPAHQINADVAFSRSKTRAARIAFVTAGVRVMIGAETNDTRALHLRLALRHPAHQPDQLAAILPTRFVENRIEISVNAEIVCPGLGFGHVSAPANWLNG